MSNGKSDYLIRTSIHTHIFHLGLYHKLNHMKKTIFFSFARNPYQYENNKTD